MECIMDNSGDFIVIYTTFPDQKTAKTIITGLVRMKLAACGNIFRQHSIYRWKGKIEHDPEYGAFIKTKKPLYLEVETYIKKKHPYDVPEIVSWTIEKGSWQYLEWIDETTARR
ncbi:MAG: divalent-cation tolerance protein CutA [bacterium]